MSIQVRTLVMAGLAAAVAILAAMLFLSGGDEPKRAEAGPAAEAPATPAAATAPVLPVAEAPVVRAPGPIRARLAPTFNCDRAATQAEKFICGDDELASLDREMARAFRQWRSVAGPRLRDIEAEQRNWRVGVRDACGDAACVANTMRQRIAQIDERRIAYSEGRY